MSDLKGLIELTDFTFSKKIKFEIELDVDVHVCDNFTKSICENFNKQDLANQIVRRLYEASEQRKLVITTINQGSFKGVEIEIKG